ncbi:uncharacterized protein LODBEIA_P05230 [Lodderomyces beijingensis]|uniref:U3 small nucleolar RNA-associated protein 22 n=1 Tax=Lodderomyces beijingensis TaxID=1775926 RepID=A0ABP0ZDN7_9ASCO
MGKRKSESLVETASNESNSSEEFTAFSDREEVPNDRSANGYKGKRLLEEEEEEQEEQHHGMSEDDDDDDDDEDVGDEVNGEKKQNSSTLSSQPPTKKQKRQLTAQDIQVAREAAELFKSNIFKLQIDELMKEVKVKKHHEDKMEKVLHRLHDLIKQIPPVEGLSLQDAEHLFSHKRIAIPFPDPKPTNVKYSFAYKLPEEVSLVGSYGLRTGINQGSSIEVALTMPRDIFQPKDYLNYRALYKRAFYLAYLAEHLLPLTKKNNLPVKLTYHYLNDDVLNPVLRIESIQTENADDLTFFKTKYTINLIASFPFGIFDYKKLLPDKNCIRVQSDAQELPATPLYNSSIITQSSYDFYLKYLYMAKKSTAAFKEACVLGRLWLQQRGFSSSLSKGGFGHFEFAILVSALLNGGGVNGNKILLAGFSSYQMFKGTIQYLASTDLNKGYLSFSSQVGGESAPPAGKYKADGFNVPTIFDKNTKLNVLWKMTTSSYQALQSKAVQTLALLNDVVRDRFDPILLQNSKFEPINYDLVLTLTIPEEVHDLFGAIEKIKLITFDNFIKRKIYSIVERALGARASLIVVENEKPVFSFAISKRKPVQSSDSYFIGLQLNPEEADKLVTRGPDNEDKEAGSKFRSFWGQKASLRRFKDGTIQHCVVWSITAREPLAVPIIKYALDLHLSPEMSQYICTECGEFEQRLPVPLLPTAANQVTNSLTSFTNLKTSFDNLSKKLVYMKLPLTVKSVLPASVALRYSSALQPVPFAVSSPDYWNDCIIQFEVSTRWPDEISALEKVKSAFLLKIHEAMKNSGYTTFLTKSHCVPFNQDTCALNILTPEGYGFRLRVLTERDEILYLRAVSNADKQKALVQDIYLSFVRQYQGSVKHTRTVSQLAQHFQYYTPVVRLFKLWLDSQLLLCHFSEELVELLVLKSFVDPAPYDIPHSVENGFLQTLCFLANWNWKEVPLILDLVKSTADEDAKLSDKLSIQAYRVIEDNFNKLRQSDPSGIKTQFFIGTKDDPSGILWSSNLTLPIATRLTGLSRVAVSLLKAQGINHSNMELLFTPALQDYDFTIRTRAQDLTTSSGVLPPNSFKNLVQPLTSYPSDIESKYDLVQAYVADLNEKFGNCIIFSVKKFTSLCPKNENVIGGLFVPASLTKRKFRVNSGLNVQPAESENDDEVVLNKGAVFDEIKLMGGELVTELDIRK